MHHSRFETDEGTVYVNHNSDWSGLVYIRYHDTDENEDVDIKLPGELLIQLGKACALEDLKNKIIAFLEDL